MTEKEHEALNALIGITNGVNSDIINRQNNYSDADRRPRFIDTEGSRESLVGRNEIENYLGRKKNFFGMEELSEEEMKRAKKEAMESGYGFAGFVDNNQSNEPNLMSEMAKAQQKDMDELKKQQSEMISETKKTNELLTQLVGVLAAQATNKPKEQGN